MWTSVVASEIDSAVPSARSKHSATLVGEHVYLLGGRNGNLPMKDFWKYNLGECSSNLLKNKFSVLTITILFEQYMLIYLPFYNSLCEASLKIATKLIEIIILSCVYKFLQRDSFHGEN